MDDGLTIQRTEFNPGESMINRATIDVAAILSFFTSL